MKKTYRLEFRLIKIKKGYNKKQCLYGEDFRFKLHRTVELRETNKTYRFEFRLIKIKKSRCKKQV